LPVHDCPVRSLEIRATDKEAAVLGKYQRPAADSEKSDEC
jgi:hypothetical protein